jgi:hypothetical protein
VKRFANVAERIQASESTTRAQLGDVAFLKYAIHRITKTDRFEMISLPLVNLWYPLLQGYLVFVKFADELLWKRVLLFAVSIPLWFTILRLWIRYLRRDHRQYQAMIEKYTLELKNCEVVEFWQTPIKQIDD